MSTLASVSSRIEVASADALLEFASDVRRGLTKSGEKELHSKYFYDELGSALFEAITLLPEYGLTRADERLLSRYAIEIARRLDDPVAVIELGSGTGSKTRHLLEAIRGRQNTVRYYPIDVSCAALEGCMRQLAESASVYPLLATYHAGLSAAVERRRPNEQLLVLFLGSTIGNFEPGPARIFLRDVRDKLWPGDAFLLGADLVKPADQLIAAYDDPTGVTGAFNLNMLARINRQLGGDFNLRSFTHEATYNDRDERVEMRLRSQVAHQVAIPGADLTVAFQAGETIWTESSHKFRPEGLARMAREAGFRVEAQWIDPHWPFAESLWIAI